MPTRYREAIPYRSAVPYRGLVETGPPPRRIPKALPRLYWTIDGIPVDVDFERANATIDGGYDQMDGTIRERILRRHSLSIDQGAPITAYEDSGDIRWHGRLSGPPSPNEGIARLAASGEKRRAEDAAGRLLYQTRDVSTFQDAAVGPFNDTTKDNIQLFNQKDHLRWRADNDVYTSGNRHAAAAWFRGSPVTRIAFTRNSDRASTSGNQHLDVMVADTPSDALVQNNSFAIDDGSAHDHDITFDAPVEVVGLRHRFVVGYEPAENLTNRVYDIRINGRAPGDVFTTGEVVADMGALLGYDIAGVQSSDVNALPFDLNDGSSWAEGGFSYMAMLDDWVWGVWGEENPGLGPLLTYGPAGPEVMLFLSRGTRAELTALELYNLVTITYETVNGARAEVSVIADPDPLGRFGVTNVWRESLTDPQKDDELAQAVAFNLIDRLTQRRYAARLEISEIADAYGNTSPYSIRPGMIADLSDFGPATELVSRIYEVEIRPDGVSAGIEVPINTAALIKQIQKARALKYR